MYTLWAEKCLCYSSGCQEAAAGQTSSQEAQKKTISSLSEGPRIPSHIHRHPSALNLSYLSLSHATYQVCSLLTLSVPLPPLQTLLTSTSLQYILLFLFFTPHGSGLFPEICPLSRKVSHIFCACCCGLSDASPFNSDNPNAATRRCSLERTQL